MNGKNRQSRTQKAVIGFILVAIYLVYCVAALYGDIMFLMLVRDIFPSGILGSIAIVGAIVTGVSAIILPPAKAFYIAPGKQEVLGWIFWAVEIAVLIMNTLLASEVAAGAIDPNLAWWASLSPATPLISAIGWGLILSMDESNAVRKIFHELQSDFYDGYKAKMYEAWEDTKTSGMLSQQAEEDVNFFLTSMRRSGQRQMISSLPDTGTQVIIPSIAQDVPVSNKPAYNDNREQDDTIRRLQAEVQALREIQAQRDEPPAYTPHSDPKN